MHSIASSRRLVSLVLVLVGWLAPAFAQEAAPTPAGERPTVVEIFVEGERRYTEAQLLAALGQPKGAPLDPEAISKGLETLLKALQVKGRVQVRDVEGGVELLLSVEEMNVDLEPRFVGNNAIDADTLRRWALLQDKGELYLYQANRVRQRLLEGYRKEGYYFAEVDVVRRGTDLGATAEGELPDVIFEIREGPDVRVQDVVITGNKSMPDKGFWFWRDGLRKLARTELDGPWLFNWKGEKFVQETLDADILAMREVYRDRGFLDAVVEAEPLKFSSDRSEVTIHVTVDEGIPYRVTELKLEAVHRTFNSQKRAFDETPEPLVFDEAELLALCRLKPGKRYERGLQNQDAADLREYYGERGYIAHSSLREDYFEFLDPALVFDPAKHEVSVTYRIAQGKQRWIRDVLFEGGGHTRDRVLRREVDVLPGELADIKKIRRSLSRLNSTGYFTDEQNPLEHRDPVFVFKPTADPNWVDLEYKVEEGRVVNFQLMGGVDSNNGLVGRISLSMHNFDIADPPESFWTLFGDIYDKEAFHGAGQRLDLEYSPGTVINAYRARFLEPDLFQSHFNRVSLELELNRKERRFRFYDEQRDERRIRLGREFGRELTVFLGYSDQDLKVDDFEAPLGEVTSGTPTGPDELPLPDSIYQQEGRTDLNGFLLDLQYRKIDTWLNPKDGITWNWRNAVYGGVAGGDYQFFKTDFDIDWFWLIGASDEDVRPGCHIGVGGGFADAFGDTSETPYTERFFLGGSRILRGFAFRGVGPNKGKNPLGGESSVDATLEYRIPLYSVVQPGTYRNIETFRLTLFTDAGILDPDPYEIDLSELRASVGFGIGMVQPFPVTLSFGFPIADGEGDRKQVFSFVIFNLWF